MSEASAGTPLPAVGGVQLCARAGAGAGAEPRGVQGAGRDVTATPAAADSRLCRESEFLVGVRKTCSQRGGFVRK